MSESNFTLLDERDSTSGQLRKKTIVNLFVDTIVSYFLRAAVVSWWEVKDSVVLPVQGSLSASKTLCDDYWPAWTSF